MKKRNRVSAPAAAANGGGGRALAGLEPVEVESYAGYRGEETPRVVTIAGKRFNVTAVKSRKRVHLVAGGNTFDVFACRLDDGRRIVLELDENGRWRVRPAS
jgi:hypothetical protein